MTKIVPPEIVFTEEESELLGINQDGTWEPDFVLSNGASTPVHVICFEGSGASSGPNAVTRTVFREMPARVNGELQCNLYVHSIEFGSTRNMWERFVEIMAYNIGSFVCIGKSAGAVHMFRILNKTKMIGRIESIISIDPLTPFKILSRKSIVVKPGVYVKTVNLYQRKGWRRGVKVARADNREVKNTSHMGITSHPATVQAMKEAVGYGAL